MPCRDNLTTKEQSMDGQKRVLMGVGNPLKGDDGVGPYLADSLQHPEWVTINCGTVPGNYTSIVKRNSPQLLVVVDAAKMGLEPGKYRILPTDRVEGMITSTHNLPLTATMEYLSDYVENEILFIGIEPKSLDYTTHLTEEVLCGAKQLKELLLEGSFSELKEI
ncbi:MAG: hydrogenase maturation peptidase HycI [Candidatus Bipolaricaulota bacterium]